MKIRYLIFLSLLLVILAGCDSGATFKVINRSDYPLYVQIDDTQMVTIAGNDEHSWEISTPKDYGIVNPKSQKVRVQIGGETYQLLDGDDEELEETTISLKAGETRNAYIWPNRASIKIVNESTVMMTEALIFKHNFVTANLEEELHDLPGGESINLRMPYAGPGNNFYYYAIIAMADGRILQFGGEDTVLEMDQQFLIVLEDADDGKVVTRKTP